VILGPPPQVVTWIRIPKPTFDLVGVIVSSLLATALFAALAMLAGASLGVLLVRRRRYTVGSPGAHLSLLHLGDGDEPARAGTDPRAVSSA
jgi:hypothetical protein